MDEEDKEQQARIALLSYFGSLARHWATVLLTTAVVFYTIVQVRHIINNEGLFTFALTFTVAEGGYAFLRMVTHGKYCELALDNEVRPMGSGTYVTKMLNGMHHNLRMHVGHGLKFCDKLGEHIGFLFWARMGVVAPIAFVPLWTPFRVDPCLSVAALVIIGVLLVLIDEIDLGEESSLFCPRCSKSVAHYG